MDDTATTNTNRFDKIDIRLDALGAQLDKKFSSVDKKFDKIDQRFVKIDEQFDKIDEQFSKTDNQFDRLTAYIIKRFDRVDRQLEQKAEKVDVQRLFGFIDSIAKRQEIQDDERLVMGHQISRLDGWTHDLANKIGHKLSA